MKYRIYWKSLATGATGSGTATFPQEQAQQIADDLNKSSKNVDHLGNQLLIHWIIPAEADGAVKL